MTYLEERWQAIVETYPPGKIEAVGSAWAQIIGHAVPSTLFLIIDLLKWGQSLRTQKTVILPIPELFRAFALGAFNHAWMISAHFLLLSLPNYQYASFHIDPHIPPPMQMLRDLLFASLCREVLFFYVHRLMHQPWWFRHFHSVHHRFHAPVAWAATYSHPVDHFLQNAVPIAVPFIVFRMHFLTLMVFSVLVLIDASVCHSGYDVLRWPAVFEHDVHHERATVNFGMLGLMDRLNGTYLGEGVEGKWCEREQLPVGSKE